MLLHIDIFREIIKHIPYQEQLYIRLTCKEINKIPLTIQHISQEPTLREIAYAIYRERRNINIGSKQYRFFLEKNRKRIHVDSYKGNVYYEGKKDGNEPVVKYSLRTPDHIIAYLKNHQINYFYDGYEELKLCRRMIQQRIRQHKLSVSWSEAFMLIMKILVAQLIEKIKDDPFIEIFGNLDITFLKVSHPYEYLPVLEQFIQSGTYECLNF